MIASNSINSSLLAVENLSVFYGDSPALRDFHLALNPGEIVALLGPSGCGKSTLGYAILGLLPTSASVQGSIRFQGRQILGAPEPELRRIRGAQIALIAQEPSLALNPVLRIRTQLALVQRTPKRKTNPGNPLGEAGLTPDLAERYPHQLSGGQRQRVLIAQAIANRPALIIADEPTASLDAMSETAILRLFRGFQKDLGAAILFITHNPNILQGFADRIVHAPSA